MLDFVYLLFVKLPNSILHSFVFKDFTWMIPKLQTNIKKSCQRILQIHNHKCEKMKDEIILKKTYGRTYDKDETIFNRVNIKEKE